MEKGFPPDVIDRTLSDLEAKNYIGDERFALQFGRSQIRHKLIGPVRLKGILTEKGISPEIVDKTLGILYEETPMQEVAREALRKKIKKTPSTLIARDLKRLSDFLRRRGFEYDIINNLLRNLRPR